MKAWGVVVLASMTEAQKTAFQHGAGKSFTVTALEWSLSALLAAGALFYAAWAIDQGRKAFRAGSLNTFQLLVLGVRTVVMLSLLIYLAN